MNFGTEKSIVIGARAGQRLRETPLARGFRVQLLGLFALVAIAWPFTPAAQAEDFFAGLFAKEKNIHYQVELRVGTEQVSIDRTVHCHPYFFGELSSPFDIYYRPDRAVLSKRLENESGVIIIVPNYCYYAFPIPADYIPPVAVVDNVEHPQRMDVYISGVRLTSGAGDVQLQRFSATLTADRGKSGLEEEFAAWRVLAATAPNVGDAIAFWALCGFATGLEPGELDDVRDLAGEHDTDALISGAAASARWRQRYPRFHLGELLQGDSHDPPYELAREIPSDPGYSIVPFVLDEAGRLKPDLQNRGVITFYRDDGAQGSDRKQRISSGGQLFETSLTSSDALYLADAKVVLALGKISEAWAPRP